MSGDSYSFENIEQGEIFQFTSTGPEGSFKKIILFDEMNSEGLYNLALCLERNGHLFDDITTNNKDFSKTMFTVAEALKFFFVNHPDATVQIRASDDKRLRVYNGIFKRKHDEISQLYSVNGISIEDEKETYSPEHYYIGFELSVKKS